MILYPSLSLSSISVLLVCLEVTWVSRSWLRNPLRLRDWPGPAGPRSRHRRQTGLRRQLGQEGLRGWSWDDWGVCFFFRESDTKTHVQWLSMHVNLVNWQTQWVVTNQVTGNLQEGGQKLAGHKAGFWHAGKFLFPQLERNCLIMCFVGPNVKVHQGVYTLCL